jgi:hypothetical protein
LAAEAELSRLAAAAPRAVVKDGVVIGADTELNARMAAVREEQRCLAEFIASHAWITASGNRYAAWKTVDQAAKAAE